MGFDPIKTTLSGVLIRAWTATITTIPHSTQIRLKTRFVIGAAWILLRALAMESVRFERRTESRISMSPSRPADLIFSRRLLSGCRRNRRPWIGYSSRSRRNLAVSVDPSASSTVMRAPNGSDCQPVPQLDAQRMLAGHASIAERQGWLFVFWVTRKSASHLDRDRAGRALASPGTISPLSAGGTGVKCPRRRRAQLAESTSKRPTHGIGA